MAKLLRSLVSNHTISTLSAAALLLASYPANSMTLTVDSSNVGTYSKLSLAVAEVYALDDGPDIINLAIDSLPDADGQVVLDKPITINGDAESGGTGNGVQCDLLADMTNMILNPITGGDTVKAYIRFAAEGTVDINNIRIHPNDDGAAPGSANVDKIVGGVRMIKPSSGTGIYKMTKVYVSGSDSSGAYVSLETANDLYTASGIKRWGGPVATSGDPNNANYAAIQLADTGGSGIYNATLDHCHAGLGKSAALNIIATGGTQTVLGGLYGHCSRDGIRAAGDNITIKGTIGDRLRIVRNTNTTGLDSHGLEVVSGSVPLIEYVDIASLNSANNFSLRGGTITLINFCRCFGKFGGGTNQASYITGATTNVGTIQNCTFVGGGGSPSPFFVTAALVNPLTVKDSIFTSLNNTAVVNTNSAPVTISNCATPNDLYTAESLANPPVINTLSVSANITDSPHYTKVLADYDWSNAQNGDGNAAVLRPSNSAAYIAAGSGPSPLVGGAGGTAVPVTISGFSLD